MGTQGTILLLEFWGCQAKAMGDGVDMARVLRLASSHIGFRIVHTAFRRFDNGGIGGFVTAYRGHIAIRSNPKDGYASVDIHVCDRRVDPHAAIESLKLGLKAKRYLLSEVFRGDTPPSMPPDEAEGGMLPAEV